MRFAVVLALWYLALSITPQPQPVPVGMGVSVAHQRGPEIADAVMDKLHPPLVMNWLADDWCMTTPECLPMVYGARNLEQYVPIANDDPTRTFLLLSETNCCGTNDSPANVAAFVRKWEAETDNPYACCGVVQWAGWEQWMNGYLANNGPIPPYWHIHIFEQAAWPPIAEFQAWMIAHDAVRPVIVTELANPWGTAEDNAELMSWMAKLVADGTVQAALWYSAPADWHHLWPTTDLMDWDATELTPLGEHWLSLQPGGANDPHATPTPEPTALDEDAQPRRVWLPQVGSN